MHRGMGGTVFEPLDKSQDKTQDKEITLGATAVAVLALGLFALCAVCFVWGYSVGHANPAETVAKASASGPSAAELLANQPKPVASQNAPAPNADQQTGTSDNAIPADTAATTGVTANAPSSPATSPASPSSSNGVVVQAALPAQPTASQPVSAAGQVQSALAQGTAWMVQIAAVSQQEDADVLVGALRKHGYVVSARRDPADNLLHVQVGPFATHAEAASMRQRLLNDGYNAIIEP